MAETTLTHIGFIADGNRRWARSQGLPTLEGHRKGFEKVQMIVDQLKDTEVKYISFFLFSTENWNRSPEEINYLMKFASDQIDKLASKFEEGNTRIALCGRPDPVDPKLWQKMQNAEKRTEHNTGLTVCICFNYGGHWEIADAVAKMTAAHDEDYTPENFRRYLYHPEVPDCDLIVRTSGEQRISGFQLWRAAYAEFLFLDKYFPAIEPADCQAILDDFHQRERRFGK